MFRTFYLASSAFCALTSSACAFLAAVAWLLSTSSPALADAPTIGLGVNLISNPGAEIGSSLGGGFFQLDDWTVVSGPSGANGFSGVPWGQPGGFPTLGDPGPEPASTRGTNLLYGGNNNASSSARQLVTGSTSAVQAAIDTGTATFDLNGWLGGYSSQGDSSVLSLTFLNAANEIIGTADIGPVSYGDRRGRTGLLFRQATGLVPAGTRSIDVELQMTRLVGFNNDGYADNLSLVIHATTVPEPNGLSLFGIGAAGLLAHGRKRRRSSTVVAAQSHRKTTTS
jgi:hypothetical protein